MYYLVGVCVCVIGESHAIDSELYLGIESLWNHRNYWINMQDCASGLQVSPSLSHTIRGSLTFSVVAVECGV